MFLLMNDRLNLLQTRAWTIDCALAVNTEQSIHDLGTLDNVNMKSRLSALVALVINYFSFIINILLHKQKEDLFKWNIEIVKHVSYEYDYFHNQQDARDQIHQSPKLKICPVSTLILVFT